MASTTSYLKLKLLGTSQADKETYFEGWRQDINGETGTSNMQLIDAACKDLALNKADKADAITNAQIDALFNE